MDKQEKVKFIAQSLTSQYGDIVQQVRARTFGLDSSYLHTEQWRFRRLIHNIMIARTNDEMALKSCTEMFQLYPNRAGLAKAERQTLINIMEANEVQYPGKKADQILQTAQMIGYTFNGIIPENHKALCTLPGIGRHAATVTLALAFNHNDQFAVDTHVSRIAKRLGLVDEDTSDLKIERFISEHAPSNLLADFSRSFVDFGKRICSYHPNCGSCFLAQHCAFSKTTKLMPKAVKRPNIKEGVYEVTSSTPGQTYKVIVTANGTSCNCQAFRFKRTCKHIQSLEE